jgi:hypothetical protein
MKVKISAELAVKGNTVQGLLDTLANLPTDAVISQFSYGNDSLIVLWEEER